MRQKIRISTFILSLFFAQAAFAYTYTESGGVEGGWNITETGDTFACYAFGIQIED